MPIRRINEEEMEGVLPGVVIDQARADVTAGGRA
jgi:hypothetical protein